VEARLELPPDRRHVVHGASRVEHVGHGAGLVGGNEERAAPERVGRWASTPGRAPIPCSRRESRLRSAGEAFLSVKRTTCQSESPSGRIVANADISPKRTTPSVQISCCMWGG